MNVLCCHCGAAHFSDEKVSNKGLSFNDCCGHGTVILDEPLNFPEPLKSMFKGTHEKSANFFENIRCYNISLSFACLACAWSYERKHCAHHLIPNCLTSNPGAQDRIASKFMGQYIIKSTHPCTRVKMKILHSGNYFL